MRRKESLQGRHTLQMGEQYNAMVMGHRHVKHRNETEIKQFWNSETVMKLFQNSFVSVSFQCADNFRRPLQTTANVISPLPPANITWKYHRASVCAIHESVTKGHAYDCPKLDCKSMTQSAHAIGTCRFACDILQGATEIRFYYWFIPCLILNRSYLPDNRLWNKRFLTFFSVFDF